MSGFGEGQSQRYLQVNTTDLNNRGAWEHLSEPQLLCCDAIEEFSAYENCGQQ